jgi:hypothetical protein
VSPDQGGDILAGLQTGEGVTKPDVEEEWVTVDAGKWGQVRTRVVRPRGISGTLPVILYIPGAGWVFGDENTHDRLVRELAVGAGATAVSPVYDRAPRPSTPPRSSRTTPWPNGPPAKAHSTAWMPRASPCAATPRAETCPRPSP